MDILPRSSPGQAGMMRAIVTPKLQVGTRYIYKVTVRAPSTQGQTVDDTRDIRIKANDWFTIDFTRPAPLPAITPAKTGLL
jgi:hypothetical protein